MVNRAVKLDNSIGLIVDPQDLIMLRKVSKLPGVKYSKKTEQYIIPLQWGHLQQLVEWKFLFGKSLRDWERLKRQEIELRQIKIKHIPGLKGSLLPYQMVGVNWIDECGGRALIADEMGLGKTVQALAWCQLHPEKRPILVVCPSIVKINWMRETLKWVTGTTPVILEGRTPYSFNGNVVIINYDIIEAWADDLKVYGFEVLLADEGHYIKSDKAKRTKAFKKVSKYIDNIVFLTGTPIENKPIEIFNMVNILNPDIFPNYWKFTHRYCEAHINDYGGRDASGSSNTDELYRILTKTVMIRRKKSEVLTELPPKQVSIVPLPLSNKKEYAYAEMQFIKYVHDEFEHDLKTKDGFEKELVAYAKRHKLEISEDLDNSDIATIKEKKMSSANSAAKAMIQMNKLKQLAVKGKIHSIIEWIDDFLESGEKLVVFALNRDVVETLNNHYKSSVKVYGGMTDNQRQKSIDRFQNDPKCNLFFGNIEAAGIGLTLTVASNVAILQYPWTPGKLAQAIDRVHRITQTKQVTVWNLIAENTIEEKVLEVLSSKEKMMIDILDGGKYDPASAVASEVIKMYTGKLIA